MKEALKSRIILILAILTAIFFVSTVSSYTNVYRYKKARDKEMATRLDVEEKMDKFLREKTTTEENLKTKTKELTKELEEETAAHQATKKALIQEQLVNQSLKEEIQKINKLKEVSQEELKQTSTSAKPRKK